MPFDLAVVNSWPVGAARAGVALVRVESPPLTTAAAAAPLRARNDRRVNLPRVPMIPPLNKPCSHGWGRGLALGRSASRRTITRRRRGPRSASDTEPPPMGSGTDAPGHRGCGHASLLASTTPVTAQTD